MLKKAHPYRRFAVPFTLAFALLLAFVPTTFAASYSHGSATRVGPKSHYLALGDSLAFGYQPDLDFGHGYVDDFYSNLKSHGSTSLANMSCPGETSVTMLNGNCPYPYLRKFPYLGSQLNAALLYLALNPGSVSPVTLDIGATDVKGDIDLSTCVINTTQFASDLATLDANLKNTILPQLRAGLTVNGKVTGDIVMMNLYDPYQNICPNSVSFTQKVNSHLATDVAGYGSIVDVFSAFGGAKTPNSNTCSYTWICSIFKDIHSTGAGYSVIANAFEAKLGY